MVNGNDRGNMLRPKVLKSHIVSSVEEVLQSLGLSGVAYKLHEKAKALDPFVMWRNLSYYAAGKAKDGLPIPPGSLRNMVCGTYDIGWFLRSGYLAAESVAKVLKKAGVDFNDFRAMLDFGCGCGRVVRHLRSLADKSEIHCCDPNQVLVKWGKENLGFASFQTNAPLPPLDFPDKKFDFIYSVSVFTHFPERLQMIWINELSRVLRTGGFLLLTVHGMGHLKRLNADQQRAFLDGSLVVKEGKYVGSNLCRAYHPEDFVRKRLARGWAIVEFIPDGLRGEPPQDAWLLRKHA